MSSFRLAKQSKIQCMKYFFLKLLFQKESPLMYNIIRLLYINSTTDEFDKGVIFFRILWQLGDRDGTILISAYLPAYESLFVNSSLNSSR